MPALLKQLNQFNEFYSTTQRHFQQLSFMMVGFGPHRIPHDYKYQSKGDFDPAAKSNGADLLSVDGSTTLVGSSQDIPTRARQ